MDANTIALGTAVVGLATAITGLVRAVLERKARGKENKTQKKSQFQPPFPQGSSKKIAFPQISTERQSGSQILITGDLSGIEFKRLVLTHPDSDHIPQILLAPHHGSKKILPC